MMDLRHLETDELQVEFIVRNLDPSGESALEKLSLILVDEQSGSRPLPSLPPFSKTSSEITLCKRKLSQIEGERLELGVSGDQPALAVLRSRTLHLVSRMERLANYDSENQAIAKIL